MIMDGDASDNIRAFSFTGRSSHFEIFNLRDQRDGGSMPVLMLYVKSTKYLQEIVKKNKHEKNPSDVSPASPGFY